MEVLLLVAGIGGLMLFDKYQKEKMENYENVGAPIDYAQIPSTNTLTNSITYGRPENNNSQPNESNPNSEPCPYDGSQNSVSLNMADRTLQDFQNNNFIPNKLKDTQNMIGTGILNCRYENFDLNTVFGNDGETPYMSTLDRMNYTNDKTFFHKKESGPLFSPSEQQVGWVNGAPLTRPDLDRYSQDFRYKNDEVPFEPLRVGPGIGIGTDIAAKGGFNAGLENRILPTNVFNYNTNSLPGRTVIGKPVSTEMPTSLPGAGIGPDGERYGVPQYKQDTFWEQERLYQVAYGSQHLQGQMEYDNQTTTLRTAKEKVRNYGFGKIKD